jgi:hypothetical protein
MNAWKVLIDKTFKTFKNYWKIFKGMPCRGDKAPRYIIACCVLHNYCQLQGMPKPFVRDMT